MLAGRGSEFPTCSRGYVGSERRQSKGRRGVNDGARIVYEFARNTGEVLRAPRLLLRVLDFVIRT